MKERTKKLPYFFSVLCLLACNERTSDVVATADTVKEVITKTPVVEIDSATIIRLKGSFSSQTDSFDNITIVHHKKERSTGTSTAFLYFAEQDNKPLSLWLRVKYYADDWLFVRGYTFKADSNKFEFVPDEVKRDNAGGDVWEWSTTKVEGKVAEIAEALASASSVMIRMHGKDYYHDIKLNNTDLVAIRETLAFYKAKGGSYE